MSKTDPQTKIGETRIMNNGLKATIIKWRNCHNIDIKFEDNIIVEHRDYRAFKRGNISHPNINPYKIDPSTKIGETRIMNNGLKATIIEWRNSCDIDIKFEDNIIVEHRAYSTFERGSVSHPNINPHKIDSSAKIGETRTMKNGLKATIIVWRSTLDIDIQFEDSVIVEHHRYSHFKNGTIAHPNINPCKIEPSTRIGETRTMKNSLKATIIEWRGVMDIDIQFEDGVIVEHCRDGEFKRGAIAHPNINPYKIDSSTRTGETRTMKNSLKATIIEWRSSRDIDIQFEDGAIIKNRRYNNFKRMNIGHPDFHGRGRYYKAKNFHHFTAQLETIVNNGENQTGLFKCKCNICGQQGIYTVDLMLDHEQEHIKNRDIPGFNGV